MTSVITLIAASARNALEEWAEHCAGDVRAAGFAVREPQWLSPNEALDLPVEDASPDILRPLAEDVLKGLPVDVIVQDADGRRKKLLVADMESTIIEQEMLEEMADALGKRAEVAEITRRAMNGELDFAEALRTRVALFAGQPEALLAEMALRVTMMPGAAALVATMRHHGAQCWLASGGFRFYTQMVAEKLGFHRECANELLIENGFFTGHVAEPILDKNTKLNVLRQGVREMGIAMGETIAVGDGANDLPMLQASTEAGGLGIAFRAKPGVRAQAAHKVNHGDLTALLFAQGYARAEFCAA